MKPAFCVSAVKVVEHDGEGRGTCFGKGHAESSRVLQ